MQRSPDSATRIETVEMHTGGEPVRIVTSGYPTIEGATLLDKRRFAREQLDRNNVDLMWGAAHFEGPNLLQIQKADSQEMITGDVFVIATGTRPATPASVPFNDTSVFTSDGLLKVKTLPKSLIVVGGGVIGVEYACMLGALGALGGTGEGGGLAAALGGLPPVTVSASITVPGAIVSVEPPDGVIAGSTATWTISFPITDTASAERIGARRTVRFRAPKGTRFPDALVSR